MTAFRATHTWGWHKWLGDRYGQPCRLVACGAMLSCLIEFADGRRYITIRRGLRRIQPPRRRRAGTKER